MRNTSPSPNMGSIVKLLCVADVFLLIVVVGLINSVGTLASGAGDIDAAREYWQISFPGVELPQNLEQVLSPMSEAQVAHYIAVKQAGHLDMERASFCEAARIACNAHEFEQFRDKVPAADSIPFFGTLKPMPGYSQYVELGDGTVVRKHGEYFRQAQLFKGSRLPLGYEKEHIPQRAFLPEPLATLFAPESVARQLLELGIGHPSHLATEMGYTSGTCTMQPLKGEVKTCVASLEDMVDLVKANIDSNSVEVVTVGSLKGSAAATSSPAFVQNQRVIMPTDVSTQYGVVPATVVDVVERTAPGTAVMVCHTMMFSYAMYHCHSAGHERVYEVTLRALDAAASNKSIIAMCHMDTTQWTPHHLAFYDLGVKPGETEACHWIHEGDVLFLGKPLATSASGSGET